MTDTAPHITGYEPDPPSTGWVVHEVYRYTEHEPVVWAWCKVQIDAPGYTEISFTQPDGHTAADPPASPPGPVERPLRLGAHLFQVWC